MKLYVHHPGHLIRSLDNPSMSTSFSYYQLDTITEAKLSQGTTLRKRQDSKEKCTDKTDAHDQFLMSEISRNFNCTPPYWTGLLAKDVLPSECTSPTKLRKVYNHIKDTKRMLTFHDPPCLDMYNAVTYFQRPMEKIEKRVKEKLSEKLKEKVKIVEFVYKEKYYEEIQYVRDFGLESFWSGIGGFVGIFLGYSMMQFPDLIGKLHRI